MSRSPRWCGAQRRIGLTGGIATGKSTVGRLLEAEGLRVLDADQYAREALAPGSPGAKAVLERYGDCVRADATGPECPTIDRGALGSIVFSNPDEKLWLEQLIHPLVRQRFDLELADLSGEQTVVLMIPLLFEVGLEALCSEIWLVDCDERQQLERLMQRDGLCRADAEARINAQWPLEEKRRLSDVVIDNRVTTGSEQHLRRGILKAI
ncbi:dephospho-CoA kinase [Synechococcus sp. W4D4]|uniref:dephospho-CoA kinase n=1 Tax=Synechococcus sp. W4D4 TaxID=3392294 RepID=UPI0039E72E3B